MSRAMTFFQRTTMYLVGILVCALIALVLMRPVNHLTNSPKAIFLPVDAVPDVDRFYNDERQVATKYTVESLSKAFLGAKYHFRGAENGQILVPPIFLSSLPEDIGMIKTIKKKKNIFFQTILPLVLKVNKEILDDRKRLVRIAKMSQRSSRILAVDRLWMSVMEDYYRVKPGQIIKLKRRIDIVPPSLALAQAAEESGWGTSRFVIEGNALFGQWTEVGDKGIIPAKRVPKGKHLIKTFPNLLAGVRAYVRNINTHRAYKRFRQMREGLRRQQVLISGLELAKSLTTYSERGVSYVETIQQIITNNDLENFDGAKLRPYLPKISKSQHINKAAT